jgi:hypothetical protein
MRFNQNNPYEQIIQRGEDGAPPLPTNVTMTLRVKVSDLDQRNPQNFEVVEKPKLELAPFPNLGGNQGNVGGINPNVNQDDIGDDNQVNVDDGNNQVNVGGDDNQVNVGGGVNQGNVDPNDLNLQLDPNDPNNQQGFVIVNQ